MRAAKRFAGLAVQLVMKYLLACLLIAPLGAQTPEQLEAHGSSVTKATYLGKSAVRLDALPNAADGESYAIVKGSRFHNGTIEVELAGKPAATAGPAARGFIGIAFRVQGNRYEYIYLRPTNGRADDQVRRNHSTQYGAHPDFGFAQMRKESPEKYESYVDLEPGVWTSFGSDRGDEGAAVCARRRAALPDRQRPEARRFGGGGRPVGGPARRGTSRL